MPSKKSRPKPRAVSINKATLGISRIGSCRAKPPANRWTGPRRWFRRNGAFATFFNVTQERTRDATGSRRQARCARPENASLCGPHAECDTYTNVERDSASRATKARSRHGSAGVIVDSRVSGLGLHWNPADGRLPSDSGRGRRGEGRRRELAIVPAALKGARARAGWNS